MSTDDFFRGRLDQMIDLNHPLAVLANRLPWDSLEQEIYGALCHRNRAGELIVDEDLFGEVASLSGAGVAAAGRPRLPTRLMISLLYLKHAFNLSDEALVARWSENVVWQYFSGLEYYQPTPPCDPTQIGRFRTRIGEEGVEELLKATIDTAVQIGAIEPQEFEQVIVDSTVQEKAIAYPVDARLLEIAREKLVKSAKALGLRFKQTHAKEGKRLRFKASGYAHARQFKRLRRVLKRQRTLLGRVIRQIKRQLGSLVLASDAALAALHELLERAEQLHRQRPKDKNKLYALHAPEVECICKGKARQRYEFGVKASFAVSHAQGLIIGARTFPGNPYDGHVLAEQLEQTRIFTEDHGVAPKEVYVDLGYRGVDRDNPAVTIVHRGKPKSLSLDQKKNLKRRQAIEPMIGHLKADHRLQRCWLAGELGDALHAVLCATGYNIQWLLRAIVRLGLAGFFAPWNPGAALLRCIVRGLRARVTHALPASTGRLFATDQQLAVVA